MDKLLFAARVCFHTSIVINHRFIFEELQHLVSAGKSQVS